MKLLRPKLIYKLLFFGFSLTTIALVITGFVLLNNQREILEENITNTALIFAEFSTDQIYQEYVQRYTHIHNQTGYDEFKKEIDTILSKNPDVIKVSVIGINGKILFDTDEFLEGKVYDGPGRFVEDPELLSMIKKEEISTGTMWYQDQEMVQIVVPVSESTSESHLVSTRYIFSFSSLKEKMGQAIQTMILTLIPIFIVTVIVSIFFSARITKPITQLTNDVKNFETDSLAGKIEIKTKDEIGTLAKAFKQMIEALEKSRSKLKNYNRDLEKEVKERTKEIEEKNKELEKFNKIAVGRELMMEKLKRKISEMGGDVKDTK